MAHSSNKQTIAIYPLCVKYIDDDRILCKGGIVFMSEDKNHDYQQVEAFEARAFEIFREKIRPNIKHRKRFSNGCGSQFWSRFVAADMVKMHSKLSLENNSYDRFEANEGKSISDTLLGSTVKCAFNRETVKKDKGVTLLADIVNLIRSEIKQSTKKFTFFIVEEFGDLNGKQIERQGQCPTYPNSIFFVSSNKISLEKCGVVLNALFKMCVTTVRVVMQR